MGVMTYQHYNIIACQRACDAAAGCTAFNMYIERSPSKDAGPGCPNPPAVFNYRCTLWGLNITIDTATNAGQYRGPTDRNGTSFHTVITASNGKFEFHFIQKSHQAVAQDNCLSKGEWNHRLEAFIRGLGPQDEDLMDPHALGCITLIPANKQLL